MEGREEGGEEKSMRGVATSLLFSTLHCQFSIINFQLLSPDVEHPILVILQSLDMFMS